LPKKNYKINLNNIIEKHKNKKIIIFKPVVDWNIPLFQRPQHIAINLARKGYLYFYCTPGVYDEVDGFNEIEDGIYLTDQFNLLMDLKLKKIIHIYAADTMLCLEFINKELDKNNIILYEYIDEIHEDIAGRSIDIDLLERHKAVLNNEKIICVVSADQLFDQATKYRTKNVFLVTNGVEIEHFSKYQSVACEPPEEIKELVACNAPIIGYYGALAKWVDYELIIALAKARPNYQILLIGWNYDKSVDNYNLNYLDNVKLIGPIDYKYLPKYASFFSVSFIPFRINDITKSTSPVKLFEYMALGKPIISTEMPECMKYQSSLIARSHKEFIDLVDNALQFYSDDLIYSKLLKREAYENSWDKKSDYIKDIITLIKAQ
jgi:glycosyltransferase involved in cell wall biosynthesis